METRKPQRVYARRWYMLAVIALLNASNAMVWIGIAPVANKVGDYFDISFTQINWLSTVFFVLFVPFCFFASWLADNKGLRTSVLVGATINATGATIRALSSYLRGGRSNHNYIALLTGQSIAAIAQPIIMVQPTKFAALWFAPDERALANSIGSMSNTFGLLLANALSPMIVQDFSDVHIVLWVYAAIPIVALALAFIFFKESAPPTAASLDKRDQEKSLTESIKIAMTDRNFVVLFFTFGAGMAIFSTVLALLQQMTCSMGYDSDFFPGIVAALCVFFGIVGGIVIGTVADKTKKLELIFKSCFFMSLVCCCSFAYFSQYPGNDYQIAVSITLMGFFGLVIFPLSLELGVECTYPEVPEATSSGLLLISGQVQGAAYFIIFGMISKPLERWQQELQTCGDSSETGVKPRDMRVPCILVGGIITTAAIFAMLLFKSPNKRINVRYSKVDETSTWDNGAAPNRNYHFF